jgi:hypothetical protein
MYEAAAEKTCFELSLYFSIIFHLLSSILSIGVISLLTHMLAKTEYAQASSKGLSSHVQIAKGHPYEDHSLRDATHSKLANLTITSSHPP